ncbi:MAG: thiamine phosphate synthase [Mariprofundaceae bacterium]|nr:thiamine phosphate synthase [Mariprofundaceae bacterium]
MCKNTGIYGILPADLTTTALLEKAEAALRGGVRLLQFRDKKSGFKRALKRALLLRELTQKYQATLMVNDSLQLAVDCGADGVHLGRDDVVDIAKIRQQVGDDFIVGITCRADARYAKSALDLGANYVSFGAVFASTSKPDVPVVGLPRIAKACAMFPQAQVCAIGGITLSDLVAVKATGASYAAVISSLFAAETQIIEDTAYNMVQTWRNAPSV